jgi:transcription initiation factor TFIIB
VCGDCGLVLGNRVIDTRSEWRTFANSDDNSGDPSRVGAVADPLLGGSNLIDSTTISIMDGGTGKARELARAHQRVIHSRGDETVLTAFKNIQHMGECISLNRVVIDSAKQLFRKVDETKLLKGKSQEASMAACIYISCREHKVSRSFKEICNLTKVSTKEIGRCFKLIQPHFETKTKISLDAYIARFSSSLDIPPNVQSAALIVLFFITLGCESCHGKRRIGW